MSTDDTAIAPQLSAVASAVHRDGIAGLQGAFPPAWADELHEDLLEALAEARSRPEGTVSRGPHRYYFSVHPERLRRFADVCALPAFSSVCTEILGEDYRIIEVGFDVPLPGATDQPWHRDFPIPPETRNERRLTSLAFNVTTVDVTPEMAPFEIAPGTHWDEGDDFDHGMFPPATSTERYTQLAERRHPRRGDMSVRTGLTMHRGTANHSEQARGVLIIGVVTARLAAGEDTDVHGIAVTPRYRDSLPDAVRNHLRCTVVDQLPPIVQRHDIEGLVMG
jgi:ectoine hydroxylase-related dioxygenase (phytanoyl-CoA dioxygenase family)